MKISRKRKRARENFLQLLRCGTTKPQANNLVDANRSWDELPHDILVDIMKRFHNNYQKIIFVLNRVCKSWLLALFDSLFPPGDVLDLSIFDQIPYYNLCTQSIYGNYLWMVLDCRQYTKLFLPRRVYRKEFFEGTAKRLPTLKCVVVHRDFQSGAVLRLIDTFRHWPNLTEAHCHASFIREIAIHCKHIRKLSLYGWIRDDKANYIANKIPQLEYLDIQSCVLSSRALSMILDGQKELKHLDTRHAARFDDNFLVNVFGCNPFGKAIDWNEEEIHPKVRSLKSYLSCPRRHCPDCAIYYDPSVSQHGLSAWAFHLIMSKSHEKNYPCISNLCVLRDNPNAKPLVSCLVQEFGKILPDNFKPIEDDSRVSGVRHFV